MHKHKRKRQQIKALLRTSTYKFHQALLESPQKYLSHFRYAATSKQTGFYSLRDCTHTHWMYSIINPQVSLQTIPFWHSICHPKPCLTGSTTKPGAGIQQFSKFAPCESHADSFKADALARLPCTQGFVIVTSLPGSMTCPKTCNHTLISRGNCPNWHFLSQARNPWRPRHGWIVQKWTSGTQLQKCKYKSRATSLKKDFFFKRPQHTPPTKITEFD